MARCPSGASTRSLKHQDGDEKVFVWQEIVQTIGTHTYPAVSVPFQKQSDVLAIKAKESEVEDRFITFQDELFVDRWQDLGEKAMEKRMHLRRQGKTDEEFLMSVEMSELRTFNERSFSWKEGKYVLHFELDSPQKFRLSGNSYRFSLSSVDIEELQRNKELIDETYRQSVIPKGEDDQEIVWNYRFPELREAT